MYMTAPLLPQHRRARVRVRFRCPRRYSLYLSIYIYLSIYYIYTTSASIASSRSSTR